MAIVEGELRPVPEIVKAAWLVKEEEERAGVGDELEQLLKRLNVDQGFVVEAEHRPNLGGAAPADSSEKDVSTIPEIDLSPFFRSIGELAGADCLLQAPEVASRLVATAGEDGALARLVAEIGEACEKWGFFQVVNHGVDPELVRNLQAVARGFFQDLPLEEKRKIRRTLEQPLGFYDAELTKNKRDWKEVFDFTCQEPRSGNSAAEDTPNSASWRSSQWPDKPEEFQAACLKYASAVERLAAQLLGLISLSLGLPFDRLHPHFARQHSTTAVRLNYYPRCPVPELALGVSRHKDPGGVTVLVQDEVGGLQVRRHDGEWLSVKPRQDAFVINLGDLFQVWSNDRYRSVEHRVVVNSDRARYSFPLFFNPSMETEVQPLPELLAGNPPHYRAFSWGYFIKSRTDGNYEQMGEDLQISHLTL